MGIRVMKYLFRYPPDWATEVQFPDDITSGDCGAVCINGYFIPIGSSSVINQKNFSHQAIVQYHVNGRLVSGRHQTIVQDLVL